jgi:hypothetical protein
LHSKVTVIRDKEAVEWESSCLSQGPTSAQLTGRHRAGGGLGGGTWPLVPTLNLRDAMPPLFQVASGADDEVKAIKR